MQENPVKEIFDYLKFVKKKQTLEGFSLHKKKTSNSLEKFLTALEGEIKSHLFRTFMVVSENSPSHAKKKKKHLPNY